MSQLLVRILLAIVMFPIAALVYLIILLFALHTSNYFPPHVNEWIFAGAGTWVFCAVYWLGLWWRLVRWTRRRIYRTLGAAVAGVVIAAGVGAIAAKIDSDFGWFIRTTVAPLSWLLATPVVWRETDEEKCVRLGGVGTEQLVCPRCGYSLTGLRSTRCPECGAEYTLDALLASQPSRAMTEIGA